MPLRRSPRLPFETLVVVLRPLVRFCVRHSLTLKDIINAAKILFVEAAEEEIRKTSKKINVSRISVLSGVHRIDVTKIFREKRLPGEGSHNLVLRILGQWRYGKRFCSSPDKPKPLSFGAADSEFSRLVQSISKSTNPGTVQFELERLGYVRREKNKLKLIRHTQWLGGNKQVGFEMTARDMDDLLNAAEQNLLEPENGSSNLHIRTEYDNIYLKRIPEIRDWFLERGKELHERAREFLTRFDKDISPLEEEQPAGGRVVVQAFSFTDPRNVSEEELREETRDVNPAG